MMNTPEPEFRRFAHRLFASIAALSTSRIERTLYVVAGIGIPLLALAMMLYALFGLPGEISLRKGAPASIAIIEEGAGALPPGDAAKALETVAPVPFLDTQRSEAPFWFRLALPRLAQGGAAQIVELPSRHAREWRCWQYGTPDGALKPLGEANRQQASGALSEGIAGFAMNTVALSPDAQIVCRARFVGPARLSVAAWSKSDFDDAVRTHDWQSGLLDGGLLILTVFVIFIATINRDWMYFLFAAWLLCGWRLAAISAGVDTQWLGFTIPDEWLIFVRKITAAGFYITTVALFSKAFENELKQVGHRDMLRIAQWSCLPVMAAALTLPFAPWLPILWSFTALASSTLFFFLVKILRQTQSRVAMFYALSLALTLLASLNEIVGAAFGMKALIGSLNSVTASLSSCLLVSFAVGQHMRDTRMALNRAEKLLRDTFETIPIGIFTLHRTSGEFVQTNSAMRRIIGNDGSGSGWPAIWGEEAWRELSETIARDGRCERELRRAMPDAQEHIFQLQAVASNGFIEGSLTDITEKVHSAERLEFLVSHDPLTGAGNRAGLEAEYARLIHESRQPMAFLNIEKFAQINDMYGLPAGDAALRRLAQCIGEVMEDSRIYVARVGADEFIIIFMQTGMRLARRLCQELIEHVEQTPFLLGKSSYSAKISIGLVNIARDTPLNDAIAVTAQACRIGREECEDGLGVFDRSNDLEPTLVRERAEEIQLLQRFGANSPPPGLFQVMQPILSMRAPFESLNFEFLLRMREGEQILMPYQVISTAEKNGRIAIIDRWVLQTTLEWLDENFARLTATRFASMNLSGGSLSDERFVADAAAMLAEHPNAASLLCIEITESVGLRDIGKTRRFVDKVKALGCKFAIDDFGAGSTSFSYLRDLNADALKIDGHFIQTIAEHPANQAIVLSIVDLARNLGMQSIAEWAEEIQTMQILQEIGIDHVQGYIVARPQAPEDILKARSTVDFIRDELLVEFLSLPRERQPSLIVAENPKRKLH